MTDYQTETAFTIAVTAAEAAMLSEAADLTDALMAAKPEDAPPVLSDGFAALFPPLPEGDAASGFRALFCDGDYPDFGCDIQADEGGDAANVTFAGAQVDTEAIAELIRRCCASALPVRFGWAGPAQNIATMPLAAARSKLPASIFAMSSTAMSMIRFWC